MKLLTVIGKGLIGGLLLFCSTLTIGLLPIALDIKFALQIAAMCLSIPFFVAWMYDFR